MRSLVGVWQDLTGGIRRATAWIRRRGPVEKLYICHSEHPNDLVYMENLTDFFRPSGIAVETIALSRQGERPELRRCLNGHTIGVLGINSQLDHSWIEADNFLDLAARAKVPVIHWVLDHSSTRWPEFTTATVANSRFLFLSPFSERYFLHYGLPGAMTACTPGNTGVSRHSRLRYLRRRHFMARPYACLIALNLRRIGGTLEEAAGRRGTLDPTLGKAVEQATEAAYPDLDQPIETHLVSALAQAGIALTNDSFNYCLQIIEETVQIRRRQWIFGVARRYPVLVQSDETAAPFVAGGVASFEANVGMKTTFARMKQARSVLNASHVNDEIHNRTINGLNAGCANIVEANAVHRRLFRHGENALLFRYDDDSLQRCLDIVCTDPALTYRIAKKGFAMRDRNPFRFGGFDNIIKLTRTPFPRTQPDRTTGRL